MSTNTNQPAKQTPAVLPEEEFNKPWDQEKLHQTVKRANDPRFGEISIVKNTSTNEILFVKEKMASSKNEASNDIRELKSRIALNHPHLQKLVNYSTAVKKELCSTHYLSRGFYEFPRSDTQKENLERKRNLSGFTSSELTHLAYQILDGLNHLHSKNITHGDIRPLNIGYHKAVNQFQILDRLADPSPLEKLQASNIVNKKEVFVCPELWKKLQGKDKTLKYSAYKNDLYALGLTILFLGNSDSVQDIYRPNGEFDQARLNEHIAAFNAKYQGENPYLCTIVKTLLAPNEADRPDSQQFISNLIPYDQYKSQEGQGVNFQGAVQKQVYSAPQNQVYEFAPQNNGGSEGQYTYNAPVVHAQSQSQPSNDRVIINRAEHDLQVAPEQSKNLGNYSNVNTTQEHTNVSYSYAQPTTNYTYTQAPTYNDQNVTYSYNQPTTTNYVYAEPTYTYAQGEPTYTYAQAEPVTYTQGQTTYVNAEPTYVQGENVTYSYAQPTTTYSYAQPTTTYSYAQPTTTYNYSQPTTTFVNANPDGTTKVEKRSYKTYTTYATPVERKSYTKVVSNTTYVQSTPTYTYSQPTMTYQSYGNTERRVEGGLQDNTTVTVGQPYTIDANGNKIPYTGTMEAQYSQYTPTNEGTRVYSQAPQTNYGQTPQNRYVQSEQKYVGDNVEVRRGSYIPIQESTEPTVVKRHYIVEGDKVIEVDGNEEDYQQHQ